MTDHGLFQAHYRAEYRRFARRTGFICACLIAVSGLASAGPETSKTVQASDFELPRLDGGTFHLSKQTSPVCVLVFIRSDGRFVPEALGVMDNVLNSTAEIRKNVLPVCISTAAAEKTLPPHLSSRKETRWVLLVDEQGNVHRQNRVIAVPTVVLLDRERRIHARFPGYKLTFGSELRAALREMLGIPETVELSPTARRAVRYASMGDRMADRGLFEDAIKSYSAALISDPTMIRARLGMTFCLLKIKQADDATTHLMLLSKADEASTLVLIGEAWVTVLKGEPQKAISQLEGLGPGASNVPEYFEAKAAAFKAIGDEEKAREAQREADSVRRGARKEGQSKQPQDPGQK